MKNIMKKWAIVSILSSSILLASGWRLPEQSASSVALSGAYVSSASGAGSAYFNPANMSFNKDKMEVESSLMAISLSSIKYKDNTVAFKNSSSEKEFFIVPTVFLSSEQIGNIRYGFSITAPGGLSKKWKDPYAKLYAEEFTLKIVELNPTIAYKVLDNFSVASGIRAIYSDGIVKNDGTVIKPVSRNMEGQTIEYGYNLALAYKPTEKMNLSLTYRSSVDLKEKGNAKIYLSGTKVYDGGATVSVPLPAVLSLAYSFKIDNTNIELGYDKTYWSEFKDLDFNYESKLPLALRGAYDDAKPKKWQDSDAFRIGVTHTVNDKLDIMLGYAKDANAAPEEYIGFELPDSDATLYSFGVDYKIGKHKTLGLAYLLDLKDSRKVTNFDKNGAKVIDGEFTNTKAHLISFAYKMEL